jgi:drug/metabolite transporter (DMT)-like permease
MSRKFRVARRRAAVYAPRDAVYSRFDIGAIMQGRSALLLLVLLMVGIGWGLTVSLATIAVAPGPHGAHDSLLVTYWNAVAGSIILSAILLIRRHRPPVDRRHLIFYGITGLIGTALPHALSFEAAAHVPAGIRSLVFALIPTLTLLLALGIRMEQPNLVRAVGIALGFAAMVVLIGPGGADMSSATLLWTLLSLLVSLSYATENLYIARYRPEGLDPIAGLWGMTVAALIMLTAALPAFGVTPTAPARFGAAEAAILGMSVLHVGCYGGLIFLIVNAGSVFASQISYIVTPAGVLWGALILSETITLEMGIALALILAGLALIKPKDPRGDAVAPRVETTPSRD